MQGNLLLIFDFEANGGTKTYAKDLLDLLHNSNFLITVYLKRNSSLSESELISLNKRFNVKYFPNFFNHKNSIKYPFLFSLYRFCFSIFHGYRYDKVVISTGNYFHFINFALFNKKLIYILHTYPSDLPKSLFKKIILKLYFFVLNKIKFNIITVSEFSKSRIINFTNFHNSKINVIYNFVKTQNPKFFYSKSKIILTVGHIEDWKNPFFWLEVAVNICDKYEDIYFYWVGAGSLFHEVKNKTPRHYLDRIKWIGNSNNVDEFYKQAMVYYQPSKIESFGLSVVEAMSFGLPCVVSCEGGLLEVVQENINGFFVEINNIEDSIIKIGQLVEDSKLRGFFSTNSIIIQDQIFSRSIWEQKMYINIYES